MDDTYTTMFERLRSFKAVGDKTAADTKGTFNEGIPEGVKTLACI